jgi:hypothetical protein
MLPCLFRLKPKETLLHTDWLPLRYYPHLRLTFDNIASCTAMAALAQMQARSSNCSFDAYR